MSNRFDNLWTSAADDGASSLAGVTLARADDGAELHQLMDAWFRERTDRIECTLVLDQARRLINQLLAEGEVSSKRRRQADRLLRAIRNLEEGPRGGAVA